MDGGTDRGGVFVLFLTIAGTVLSHTRISDTAGDLTATFADSDYFGFAVAGMGDVNNDGVVDLAVGAYGIDDGGSHQGGVFVLLLTTSGTVLSHSRISDTAGDLTATFNVDNDDHFGWAVAGMGDMNGDGVPDLAVGVDWMEGVGIEQGGVFMLFLTSSGAVLSHARISDTAGDLTAILANEAFFGSAVAGMGDVNGDDVPDLAVGARGIDDGGGGVYVLLWAGLLSFSMLFHLLL